MGLLECLFDPNMKKLQEKGHGRTKKAPKREKPEIRQKAAHAIGKIGDPRTVEPLKN